MSICPGRNRGPSESSTDSSIIDVGGNADQVHYTLLSSKQPTKSKTRDKAEKFSSSLVLIALVLSVLAFVAVSVCGCVGWYYMHLHRSDFSRPEALENEKVCMPCAQVNPDPMADASSSNLQGIDLQQDGEAKMCCAQTPAEYASLFKLILQRQEQIKKVADIWGSAKQESSDAEDGWRLKDAAVRFTVSAHLLSKPYTSKNHTQTVQQWKSPAESPKSHVTPGLKLYNNTLYVQSQGLYFVYCQILLSKADKEEKLEHQIGSHYIHRYSLAYPATSGILFKARHTRVSGSDDRHSSYVGGAVWLHPGDQLFVQVSLPHLVSNDDTASFLGLFKVGN